MKICRRTQARLTSTYPIFLCAVLYIQRWLGCMSEPSTGEPNWHWGNFLFVDILPAKLKDFGSKAISLLKWSLFRWHVIFFRGCMIKFQMMTNVVGNHPTSASEMVVCLFFWIWLVFVNPPIQDREMDVFSIRFWDHMRSWDDTNVHPDFKHIKHSVLSFFSMSTQTENSFLHHVKCKTCGFNHVSWPHGCMSNLRTSKLSWISVLLHLSQPNWFRFLWENSLHGPFPNPSVTPWVSLCQEKDHPFRDVWFGKGKYPPWN